MATSQPPSRSPVPPAGAVGVADPAQDALALGDGVGAVYSSPWPVAGERRARRGSNPVYKVMKAVFIGVAVLAVGAMGLSAWLASQQPGWSGVLYATSTAAVLVLAALAGLYIMRRLVMLALDRRGRLKGGKLHSQVLGVFLVVALLPALAVGSVGILILNRGVDGWFTDRVVSALEGGSRVAAGYLAESARTLLAETAALRQDPWWQLPPLLLDRDTAQRLLRSQQLERQLDDLLLADESGQVLISALGLPMALPPEVSLYLQNPSLGVGGMPRGEVFRQPDGARLFAAVPLSGGRWLVASRSLPPTMQAHLQNFSTATTAYLRLQGERQELAMLFTMVMVLLLVGSIAVAVWAGIRLANRLSGPLTALVHATNRVSAGDLTVRLTPRNDDELGVLTQAFNRMTHQLAVNAELVERKNDELDARRRLTEAVLLGVSAGVVAVDEAGVVRMVNPSATHLLGLNSGDKLAKVAPELNAALRDFHAQLYEAEVHQRRLIMGHTLRMEVAEGDWRTLQVRLLPIGGELGKSGVVLTFDDITPLVGAQRLAAWQDVARRLAHEIKNPLTPIQLSAGRMKRKYLAGMAKEDQPLFGQLADTIVNAAEEMRRMVNEFSDFARMPQAQRQPVPLATLVSEALALQGSREGVQFALENQAPGAVIEADTGQVQRVLTNLMENAVQAIAEREGTNLPQGQVDVVVQIPQPDKVALEIHDNGRGLPEGKDVDELFDPYVTTRKHGTGLGLAIVKKVMDEHGGSVRLQRRSGGGTTVTLTWPLLQERSDTLPMKEAPADDHANQAPDAGDSDRRRRSRRADRARGDFGG